MTWGVANGARNSTEIAAHLVIFNLNIPPKLTIHSCQVYFDHFRTHNYNVSSVAFFHANRALGIGDGFCYTIPPEQREVIRNVGRR